VGFLLQGIFLTQGSNLCRLHWQADSLLLSHQGSQYGSGPITSWEINGETVETGSDFIFLGSKITADGKEIQREGEMYVGYNSL